MKKRGRKKKIEVRDTDEYWSYMEYINKLDLEELTLEQKMDLVLAGIGIGLSIGTCLMLTMTDGEEFRKWVLSSRLNKQRFMKAYARGIAFLEYKVMESAKSDPNLAYRVLKSRMPEMWDRKAGSSGSNDMDSLFKALPNAESKSNEFDKDKLEEEKIKLSEILNGDNRIK